MNKKVNGFNKTMLVHFHGFKVWIDKHKENVKFYLQVYKEWKSQNINRYMCEKLVRSVKLSYRLV